MAGVVEVAEYILKKLGSVTPMKLQKLVYYSQAWHLAWTGKPLFLDKIEAWRNGPVVPRLFEMHKGHFEINPGFFAEKSDAPKEPLTEDEKDAVDRVISYYGNRDPEWLSQLTHLEDPWKNARAQLGHKDGENSSAEISHSAMFEYYSSL